MHRHELGLIVRLEEGIDSAFESLSTLGFPTCQLSTYAPAFFAASHAERVAELSERYGTEVTLVWAGWPGRLVWDFVEGPSTIGLVPAATRAERCDIIRKASDFAKWTNVSCVATHAGFVPESPSDPIYDGLVRDLADVAHYCRSNGQSLCFETGQETPVALLRLIEDIGAGNLGISFDPANLVLYGKANPIDALGIIGRWVRAVHVKDGRYPTNGRELGVETPLGEGQVNIPRFLSALDAAGYGGPLTIETEVTGPDRLPAIRAAKQYLESLLQNATS